MKRLFILLQLIIACLISNSQVKITERDTATIGGIMQIAGLNTIDDLRSATIYHLGFKRVWTRGYYSAGDDGGGTYIWSDTSMHADDGGGYIKPTALKGPGRWVLLPTNGVVNLKQFGARNEYLNARSVGFDNRQSIINALDFCNGYSASGYNYSRYKLYIPTIGQLRFYYVSDSIVVSTSIEMYGDPGDFTTGLMFPSGKAGLIFPYPKSSGHVSGVHGCYIHDLRLMSNATGILLHGRADGMIVRSANKFERLYIAGFPNDGVAIIATAPIGNANNSYFQSVACSGNFGNGFFMDGADVNNITFLLCDASSNGGWGFWDSSFLGCNFFGSHTAENGLKYTQVNHLGNRYQAIDSSGILVHAGVIEPGVSANWKKYWLLQGTGSKGAFYPDWSSSENYYPGGAYYLDNPNQLGALVGSYSEGGQPISRNLGGSMFMNGFASVTRPSHYMLEGSYGTEFDRIAGQAIDGMHVFVNHAGYKAVFGISDDVHGYNLGWEGDSANKLITSEQSNSPGSIKLFSNKTPASFLGRSSEVSPGSMGTSDYFYFKSSTGYKRFSFSNAAPVSGAWEAGDFVMNSSPATGSAIGWRCIVAGSPGTWEALNPASSSLKKTGTGSIPNSGFASFADLRLTDFESSPITKQAGAVNDNGTNLTLTDTGNMYTVAKVLSGSATLDFPNTAAQTDHDLTITVKGASEGDEVFLGVPNSAIVAGGSYSAWVSAANTVTVRFSDYSRTNKDPGSGTFKVSVIKR